jgi:hypothetical protein
MSQTFRKYELTPTQWATARKKIEKTGTDPEGETYTYWNPDLVSVVVDLANFVTEWGTDAEGNQTYASSNRQRFPLTSFGLVSHLADFNQYLVWPNPVGVSSMGYTLDTEYAQAFCVANPTAAYCQPPVPPVTE